MEMVSKVDGGDFRTVAELARELGVSSTWLVTLCRKGCVPGVVGEGSLLSPEYCRRIRDGHHRIMINKADGCHSPLRRVMPLRQSPSSPGRAQYPGTAGDTVGSNGQGASHDRAIRDVQHTVAKARNLIEGGHFDCAIITLYSAIENELRARDTQGLGADNNLIDGVLAAPEYETLRKDLHRIRSLVNRARHECVEPSHYDAEKAMWVFNWLFGPYGEFGGRSQMSA